MSNRQTSGRTGVGTATLEAPAEWEADVPMAHDYLVPGNYEQLLPSGRRPPDVSMARLHLIARRLGIPGGSTMSKYQLIDAIRHVDRGAIARTRRW